MDRRRIGICDSGVGGITVARVLHELLPKEGILFIGDSARNPYGNKKPEAIHGMAEELKQFLLAGDVKMIIAACNTITFNVAPSFYEGPVPVQGMPLVLPERTDGGISAFATPATVQTHRYRDFLKTASPASEVREIPFEGLADAIEQGKSREELSRIIAGVIEEHGVPDRGQIILACTHYPLVTELFQEALPHAAFHDPAAAAAREAVRCLTAREALTDEAVSSVFYFTAGAEGAEKLIRPLFGEVPVKTAALSGV